MLIFLVGVGVDILNEHNISCIVKCSFSFAYSLISECQ